jgi:hypothetical protein
MRLLVKNQKENEPKESVMPDKEDGKSPCVMKKCKAELKQILLQERNIRRAQSKDICDCKGTVYPEYEEQS